MGDLDGSNGAPRLLTPATAAKLLPTRAVLASDTTDPDGVTIHRYRHPPGPIEVPGLRDHLLVEHLAGPVLVEAAWQNSGRERRWTGPGQVNVTPFGDPIRRVLTGRPDVALIFVPPGLLRSVAADVFERSADDAALVPRLAIPDATASSLIRLLLAEAESPGPAASLMLQTVARALAVHLLRSHSSLAPLPPRPPPSLLGARFRRVIDHMRSCLDEDLTLGRLAEVSGLGPSQFARAFRGATGQPPHRYLTGLRIEKAREMLEQTDLQVIEIGLRCGFEQPNNFATAFRAATGFSPRAWRQARRD